jgi:membrane-associated phospholipid phosphatase
MTRSNLSTIPAGIAWGTSVLFSPFLVPIATAVGVVQKYADPPDALRWLVIIAIFITVLPILSIALMVRSARVSDFHLQNREERLLPLCCTLISMIVGTVLLHHLGAAREIVWAGIAYIANSVIFSAITPIWKISFHSSVATGCVTVLVMLVNPQFGWLFLLIPLISWARVYRKRHTLLQTVVGAVLAVGNTVVVLYMAQNGFRLLAFGFR